jgi:hypothetical protein
MVTLLQRPSLQNSVSKFTPKKIMRSTPGATTLSTMTLVIMTLGIKTQQNIIYDVLLSVSLFSSVMLSVIMPSVFILNVVMARVFMLSVIMLFVLC